MLLNDPDALQVLESGIAKRRACRWRFISLLLLVALVCVVCAKSGEDQVGGVGMIQRSYSKPHIARIRIEGTMYPSKRRIRMMKELSEKASVKAVLLQIDSHGGMPLAAEELYEVVRQLSEKKPVVTLMEDMATSAAYIVSIAADRVYARNTTITGSMGVILDGLNYSELMSKVGVRYRRIASSPLKGGANPFREPSKEVDEADSKVIADAYDWFVGLVKDRRMPKASVTAVRALCDGRVYTGRQAVKLNLVDEIGGEAAALKWLESKRNVETSKVLNYRPGEEGEGGAIAQSSKHMEGRAGVLELGKQVLGSLAALLTRLEVASDDVPAARM